MVWSDSGDGITSELQDTGLCFIFSAKRIHFRERLWPLFKWAHESYLLLEDSDCLLWNLSLLACLLSHGIVTLVVTMQRLCCSPPELLFFNVKVMTYPATEIQTLLRKGWLQMADKADVLHVAERLGTGHPYCRLGCVPGPQLGFVLHAKIDTLQNTSWGWIKTCE